MQKVSHLQYEQYGQYKQDSTESINSADNVHTERFVVTVHNARTIL